MITDVFGDYVDPSEVLGMLMDGADTEGECLAYSNERGMLSSIEVKPSLPQTVFVSDDTYGSGVYSIDDVEEAVDTFLGYVEMHEKAGRPRSRVA